MIVIDDNMLKLAKMQETLLKVSIEDRDINLEKYKNTVIDIDEQAFSSLLNELSQISEHNRTLEDELQFLEQVSGYYNQLYELQCSFRRVCETYGDCNLKLSNLSQIDIEYIESRINTINGYLINLKNIEINKNKLFEFNEKLINEENRKKHLSQKLLDYEQALRDSFLNAEGRTIESGQLQYISIISEYEKLGYDFRRLLENLEQLDSLVSTVMIEKTDIEEKLQTAEICYNNIPNFESKQILDGIRNDCLKVRYRLTMLKILQILSRSYDDFESFKEKRENLVDLIKYRSVCLERLDIKVSFDPFARTKLLEQFNEISSLTDNSKAISSIKKEIVQLSERVDEMVKQNSTYLVSLNDTKDTLIDEPSINNIGDSNIILDIEDYIKVEKAILDNQVVRVDDISEALNMNRIKQKTGGVIKRVSEMITSVSLTKVTDEEVVSPELVIVPMEVDLKEDDTVNSNVENIVNSFEMNEENIDDTIVEGDSLETKSVISKDYNLDIFETVDPFIKTPLFVDRTEDSFVEVGNFEHLSSNELEEISKKDESNLELGYSDEDMPDAFWVTQDEKKSDISDDVVLSFDEQINELLSAA